MHPLHRRSTRTHVVGRKPFAALVAALVAAAAVAGPAAAQEAAGPSTVPVGGQVVDRSTGQPLAGAYVELAGTHLETLTDEQGRFTFRKVRPGEHTVAVSLLGYAELEHKQTVAAGQPAVRLALEPDPVLLEGLTVNLNVLEQRRNRIAVASRAFDRTEIRGSAAVNMEAF
ncbi:MAG TPA: carboxypeptidase-like regulatory domain-containing protein, partial [Longimicrobiaceae bacterium]|nr:carboxypeptidase-like regulatory domain-containing protein [Longimicrobiaceae bacterium]